MHGVAAAEQQLAEAPLAIGASCVEPAASEREPRFQPERASRFVDPRGLFVTIDHCPTARNVFGIGLVEQVVDSGADKDVLADTVAGIDREHAESRGWSYILADDVSGADVYTVLTADETP